MKNTTIFLLLFVFSIVSAQEKLDEVKIQTTKKGIKKSNKITANTTLVSSEELLKAACCNLAESFETNPSIDVNFSDAVTGTKQIKMLGLTSPYILITEENIPTIRGASQAYGLSFTPGTWVESIQITKGAGSVVNGYESISGQINTELIKPFQDIPLFVNIYGDSGSRYEANLHINQRLSDKWATTFLVHNSNRFAHHDFNNDNFLDNPKGKQLNFNNRWQYQNTETGWVSFFNIKTMVDDKQSGEVHFDPIVDKLTTNHWGSEINTERYDFSSKVGYVFKDMPYQSIGFQNAVSSHNQDSYFGLNQYNIKQESLYSNLILNSIIQNTRNKFATGINFTYDKYNEFVNQTDFSRTDNSVGAFFEYSFDNNDKVSYVLGARADYHNRLGVFFTPRMHVKYDLADKSTLRFSAGRGKRAANIFAENQQYFATSRIFKYENNNGNIYGFNPEIACNYGLSFNQKFNLFSKKSEITLDFYRTDFQNQVVVDVMNSSKELLFYDLVGQSFANSFQFDFSIEIIKHLNLLSAYKYFDVQTDYISGRFQKPLQPKHRFFTNLEFQTHILDHGQQWKFNTTFNWFGKQQLPTTIQNLPENQLGEFSPSISTLNFQVTRTFSSVFEMYLGGENVTNVQQNNAVLGGNNPFGADFDATIVYGPIFGQMYYAGLRFKIK